MAEQKIRGLERIGNGDEQEWKRLNVRPETHEKLVKICKEQNTKIYEMVRFLVDLADAGKIDFNQGS